MGGIGLYDYNIAQLLMAHLNTYHNINIINFDSILDYLNLQLSFKVGDLSNNIYLIYLLTLFQGARLFQQYLVDAFATVDQTKLE